VPGYTDILMITHNRPQYTRLSLERLLATGDDSCRMWVWHNGGDSETLEVVRSFEKHPRLYRIHHSPENLKLTEPTNWFWRESDGEFVGKVDDDCIVPDGWIETLVAAHEANAELGVVGCWHFMPEDTTEEQVAPKVVRLNGLRLFRNCWIGGSGYIMKRAAQAGQGPLRQGQSWPQYVLELSARGWINGWYYPFLYQEHMDDPRSQYTLFKSDEDVRQMAGLTAKQRGITTLASLLARQQVAVQEILDACTDPKQFVGWRRRINQLRVWLGLPDGRRK
jgi:glycosyltransferase involved in cell wall biosynthesis